MRAPLARLPLLHAHPCPGPRQKHAQALLPVPGEGARLLVGVLGDGPLVPPRRAFGRLSWWERGGKPGLLPPCCRCLSPFSPREEWGELGRGVPSTTGG